MSNISMNDSNKIEREQSIEEINTIPIKLPPKLSVQLQDPSLISNHF